MPLHPDFTRFYGNNSEAADTVVILPFCEKGLVCVEIDGELSLLKHQAGTPQFSADALTLGSLNGASYITFEVAAESEFPNARPFELRSIYGRIPLQEWLVAGYAAQILHWRKTSGFCPVCRAEMGPMGNEWSRSCTKCGHERYPQVSPALLILVHDGANRILMAHKPGWGDRYSIFAGFVLPGESLEECVHREVAEEAGVVVNELEYSGSQPWPFPHQLMIGFRAKYLSGEIEIDRDELDDAQWFYTDDMPTLPGQLSLSRQMIDTWVTERRNIDRRR